MCYIFQRTLTLALGTKKGLRRSLSGDTNKCVMMATKLVTDKLYLNPLVSSGITPNQQCYYKPLPCGYANHRYLLANVLLCTVLRLPLSSPNTAATKSSAFYRNSLCLRTSTSFVLLMRSCVYLRGLNLSATHLPSTYIPSPLVLFHLSLF